MSVEVKDFRKFVENRQAKLEEEVVADPALLQQAVSEKANTGDDKLDKCIRVYQDTFDALEAECKVVAEQGMGAFQADMRNLAQLKWMFLKGKAEGYKEAMDVPARVVLESQGKAV